MKVKKKVTGLVTSSLIMVLLVFIYYKESKDNLWYSGKILPIYWYSPLISVKTTKCAIASQQCARYG
jgi:hypothetical protein